MSSRGPCGWRISENTFYLWKRQYGNLQSQDVKRLKELERENGQLKRLLAERDLEVRDLEVRDLEVRDLEVRDLEVRDLEVRDLEVRDLEVDAVRSLLQKNGWTLPSGGRERSS